MVALYSVLLLKVLSLGVHSTFPLYCVVVTLFTGVAPAAGVAIPGIAAIEMILSAVNSAAKEVDAASPAMNDAVMNPEPAALFADTEPGTLKKFAVTPIKVKPSPAFSAIVAVYSLPATKTASLGLQLTVPEYCAVELIVVRGAAPARGGVIPVISAEVICTGAALGKTAVITPELAVFLVSLAPGTLKKFAGTPERV